MANPIVAGSSNKDIAAAFFAPGVSAKILACAHYGRVPLTGVFHRGAYGVPPNAIGNFTLVNLTPVPVDPNNQPIVQAPDATAFTLNPSADFSGATFAAAQLLAIAAIEAAIAAALVTSGLSLPSPALRVFIGADARAVSVNAISKRISFSSLVLITKDVQPGRFQDAFGPSAIANASPSAT